MVSTDKETTVEREEQNSLNLSKCEDLRPGNLGEAQFNASGEPNSSTFANNSIYSCHIKVPPCDTEPFSGCYED